MNQLLIYITLFFLTLIVDQGGSGFYYISGKAYDNVGVEIKNERITVFLSFEEQEVLVDSLGNYEAKIPWESTCPSGRTREERERINRMLNGDSITFGYKNQHIKIKNEWKKYARLFSHDRDEVTKNLHLNFE